MSAEDDLNMANSNHSKMEESMHSLGRSLKKSKTIAGKKLNASAKNSAAKLSSKKTMRPVKKESTSAHKLVSMKT